jgi:hypothetical protein
MNASAAGSQSRSRISRTRRATLAAVVLLLGAATFQVSPLHAEDDPAVAPKPDTTVRALRLSYVEGSVQVVQDGQVIADPALVNQPIFEGAQVITANDGQAEVQLEDGSVARLSPNSTLTFTVLQPEGSGSRTEIVVNSGLAYFELQPSTAEHRLRISYGTTSFTASSFTVARIMADQPPGELAVFSGNVHLEHGNSLQLDLHGGESLSLNSNEGNGYDIAETIEQNSWDSWNADRDEILNSEVAEKTPASGAIGASAGAGMSDLDANGSWYNVPDQGYVWSPYVAQSVGVGWDPYGYGHWVFYPRRGYVWVSGYGWGYAPFSCGLWNYYDNFGWGWAPGGGCGGFWGGGGGFYGGGWYGGGGGWYNIGRYPSGYRPPRRPGGPAPVGGPKRPVTIVAVDRRTPGAQNPVAVGGPKQPVTIAGHQVEPLRPINTRQSYSSGSSGGSGSATSGVRSGFQPGQPGHYGVDGGSGGYVPRPTSGLRPGGLPSGLPSSQPGNQPIYRPGMPSSGRPQPGYQPQPSRPLSPAPRPSGGGSSAPRPSGGGGGGGAPHPSGGGGGGGGHPAGGGSPHK